MDSCAVLGCNVSPKFLMNVEYDKNFDINYIVCGIHRDQIVNAENTKVTVKEL